MKSKILAAAPKLALSLFAFSLCHAVGVAQAYTPMEQACFDHVQDQIAYNAAGNKHWVEGNVRALCKGARTANRRGECFQQRMPSLGWKVAIDQCSQLGQPGAPPPQPPQMGGGGPAPVPGGQGYTEMEQACYNNVQDTVAWDQTGNKHWAEANARNLCKGAKTANMRAACFEKRMPKLGWEAAIEQCSKLGQNQAGPTGPPTGTPSQPAACATPWWASTPATGSNATWMQDNYSKICTKQLREIAIPGTHDAATNGVTSVWLRNSTLSDSSQMWGPDMEPGNVSNLRFLSLVSSQVEGWAKAQDQPISVQLNDGIRYLDLRPCVDGFGKILTCHSLYATSMDSILTDVKNFVANHPGELIILGLNHFWDGAWQTQNGKAVGEREGMRPEKWTALINSIHSKLDGKLIPNNFDPTSRWSDIQQQSTSQQTYQVIVSIDASDTNIAADLPSLNLASDRFLWINAEAGTWIGTECNLDKYKAGTRAILQKASTGGYAGKFYAVRASLSPDFYKEAADPSANYPHNLQDMADQTNPVILGWIKNEWTDLPVNLIWADGYERTDLVKLAEFRNGIQVDWTGTKLGTSTAWGTWRAPIAESYANGVGSPLGCAANEDPDVANFFCYPKCRPGYSAVGPVCYSACPSGFADRGPTCEKPAPYGRGSGYAIWNENTCNKENSQGCEQNGAYYYPKCNASFHAVGCCICSPDCPAGMTDTGVGCAKESYGRTAGTPLHVCPAGTVKDPNGRLCYPPCKDGWHMVGPICWRDN